MRPLLCVLAVSCFLPCIDLSVADEPQPRTEKELLDELKKLGQPLDAAKLKELAPDEAKALI